MERPISPDEYPGLPRGAFNVANLSPQAAAARGAMEEGVWTAAVGMYLNTVDPQTGKPYNDQHQLVDVADGAVNLAATSCRVLAIEYSAASDKRGADLAAEATEHLAAAVNEIEHSDGILDEVVIGPDGEPTTGRDIQITQARDEELARQRSSEGDSRHTENAPETSWRVIAAVLLGLLDVLLLWKPLLNLAWQADSGSLFRWLIGAGLAGLQVFAIEWSVRSYVAAERLSVDRRGAMGDYNYSIRSGRAATNQPAPEEAELVHADTHLAHAYRWLVVTATCIAVIGGVRVAVLAKRAAFPVYEAALFGTIVGLLLGGVVVQLARLYCRGNLLGDRLAAEREILIEIDDRIQHTRAVVARERERALAALARADAATERAEAIRNQTVADYWRAVQLAWTWFGLPHAHLSFAEFEDVALPIVTVADADRKKKLHNMLNVVNGWLANVPKPFAHRTAAALIASGPAAPADPPARPPSIAPPSPRSRVIVVGPQPIPVPARLAAPHLWMLVGAVATLVAALVTSVVAPGPEVTDVVSAMIGR